MPGMSGLDLHDRLTASGQPIPTILITAFPNDRVRARALGAGVVCYLVKPFGEGDLLRCLRSILGRGAKAGRRRKLAPRPEGGGQHRPVREGQLRVASRGPGAKRQVRYAAGAAPPVSLA